MIPEFIDTWQMTEPGKLIKTRIPMPALASGDVVIQIKGCGVCHTDLHAAEGDWPVKPTPPFIPGHEVAGIVAELGAGVTGFKEGDAVGVAWLGFMMLAFFLSASL